jgi:hypothetical protein
MVEASKSYIYLKVRSGLELILDDRNGLGSVEVKDGGKITELKDVLGPELQEAIKYSDKQLLDWFKDPDNEDRDELKAPSKVPESHWWWKGNQST